MFHKTIISLIGIKKLQKRKLCCLFQFKIYLIISIKLYFSLFSNFMWECFVVVAQMQLLVQIIFAIQKHLYSLNKNYHFLALYNKNISKKKKWTEEILTSISESCPITLCAGFANKSYYCRNNSLTMSGSGNTSFHSILLYRAA
jgi:hypothetical protein